MNKRTYISKQVVRFRRWSRAKYAVFSSLSVCVTIGKVCKSICEMSSRKSNVVTQNTFLFALSENDIAEENSEPDEFIAEQKLEQILINYTLNSVSAAPAGSITYLLLKPSG